MAEKPAYRQVLVKVMACSFNFRDLGIVGAAYRIPVSDNIIRLSDGASEVIEVGAGFTRIKVGDKVASCFFQRWPADEPTSDAGAPRLKLATSKKCCRCARWRPWPAKARLRRDGACLWMPASWISAVSLWFATSGAINPGADFPRSLPSRTGR